MIAVLRFLFQRKSSHMLLPSMADPQQSSEHQQQIFGQLSFAVIRSASLPTNEAREIASRLRIHGAQTIIDTYPEDELDLSGITHVISSTSDFPDYDLAVDSMIPVVKPPWVDECILKQRLVHTRQFSPDPHYFMSDVVVCCADIPEGDADAIAGGILAMGGNFTSKVTALTTHIVALSLDNEICDIAKHRGWNGKHVIPHWFDDCLKLGRKIDEGPYELPDPEILRGLEVKPPIGKQKNNNVKDAMNPHPGKEPTRPTRKPLAIFKGRTIKLSDDLGIGEYLRGVIHGMIVFSDGDITEDVSEANFYICRYREGSDYVTASRAGVDVGNLAWLYYLILHDQWTSPLRRLLHYPVPRQGVPGFHGLKISLSNYSGEARTYLEHLINATGAECTKTLRQENTHLITAHNQSEKCAAARDWNVHMINHLWLEESYAKCEMQSITVPRYSHFPARTNLGEVVGQTQINRDVIERMFAAEEDVPMADAPALGTDAKAVRQADSSPSVPTEDTTRKLRQVKPNGARSELATPAHNRIAAYGKENITPTTTGSRKSKQLANEKLHSLTPDIALYEKERKRVGGVVYGGRRKGEKIQEVDERTSRKRSIDEDDSDSSQETDTKKPRKGPAPIAMHLLVSGYKKWVGKPKEEDADLKKLRDLGIVVVTDPAKATHLAAPHIIRTPKFVIALAHASSFITTAFIDACLAKKEFQKPEQHRLKDMANEKKIGVSIEVACERAKKNKQRLLAGRSIYVVENINGGPEAFQGIVEANGGQCLVYRGRPGTVIPSKRAGSDADSDDDPSHDVYLISSEAKEDQRVWSRFMKMVESSRKVPHIVKSDWLLDTAMCQEIQPTAAYELGSVS